MPIEFPNNEKELFLLIAEGNEEAFREIFHTYNAKLFPFILNLTKLESDAEEIMQNVFLKLWLNRNLLQDIENPGGWLYRVASNMALTFLRNKATGMKHAKLLQDSQSEEADTNLLQQLDAAELRNLVAEAVEKLPAGQRQVFFLSRTEGLSRQEIAQRIGISESTVKNQLGAALNFVLSNDEIEITGDANEIYAAKVKGGESNAEWSKIKADQMKLVGATWDATKKSYEKRGDSTLMSESMRIRRENSALEAQLQKDFIAKNPNSLVSMYFLSGMLNSLSLEELKSTYAKLGLKQKSSSYARRIAQKIESTEATAVGKAAVAINKKDINGNPVNLQTLKGKYVLIDFWGSWCGPCRASHPHLKELYSKYKDQGFEVLGIAYEQRSSIEDSRRVWKEAIAKDGLPWLQVLNNEDVEKFDAVSAYGVTAFPTKILLDREGKIIARYLGESEEFDKKLKEIFGK